MAVFYKKKQTVICDFGVSENVFSPEITKRRPVIIIYAHNRMRSVLAVPLTSQQPENGSFVYIPKDKLFGMLKKQDSWVLCDMIYHISYKRLFKIYDDSNKKSLPPQHTKIDDEIFKKIINQTQSLLKA